MRVPVVEQTDLFKRAIGEYTDVVEKEMYSFEDKGGERLTLRPAATAGHLLAGGEPASNRRVDPGRREVRSGALSPQPSRVQSTSAVHSTAAAATNTMSLRRATRLR